MSLAEERPLPLADVLSPAVAYEWSHAVAIALQLVDQLSPGSHQPPGSFPDVDRIALSPAGFLLTQLEPRVGEPLAGLGRLLQRLLGPTSPPAPLRLLAMRAADVRPTLSFGDLTRELAKWERSDRREILTHLYKRATHRDLQAALPSFAPPKPVAAKPPVRHRPADRRPLLPQLVLAAAGAAAVSVVATYFLYAPKLPQIAIPLIGIEVAAAAAGPNVPPAVLLGPVDGAEWAGPPDSTEQAGHSRVGATVQPVSTERPNAAQPVSRPQVDVTALPLRTAASAVPAVPPVRADVVYSPAVVQEAEERFRQARGLFEQHDYAAAAAAFLQVVEVLERGDPTLELRMIAAELAGTSRALSSDARAEPARVYTSTDHDVTAPVALAHLPPPAPPGTPAHQVGVLELLIDARGHVESAHLIGADQHFRDRWLISAAKAWLFEPAMKQGEPVRFLKRHTFVLGSSQ